MTKQQLAALLALTMGVSGASVMAADSHSLFQANEIHGVQVAVDAPAAKAEAKCGKGSCGGKKADHKCAAKKAAHHKCAAKKCAAKKAAPAAKKADATVAPKTKTAQ